jgi:O-antigen/teichoic acid export membrane protein
VLLFAAPWILHLGTGDFAPTWGAPEIPTWVVIGTFATAGIGVALGWLGVRRGLPPTHRARYSAMVTASVIVLTPIALIALFQLVHIFAVVLALPYALALVAAFTGWRKKTPKWAEK